VDLNRNYDFGWSGPYGGSTNQYFAAWKTQQPGYFNKGRGRLINADGSLPGNDVLLGNGHENSIAYNPQSTEYLHTARSPSIKGRRVSAAGAPLGAEILIESAGAPAPNGQVAYDSNNDRFLATWRDQVNDDLRGRLIGADGSLLAPSFIIWPNFPASGRAASLAFDAANDRYLVVFGVFQGTDILGQFVSGDGVLIGDPFFIVTGLPISTDPYCAFSPASEVFVVVWFDGSGIMARSVLADGTVSSEALELTRGTALGSPRIAHNSIDDQFLVVWSDSRNIGMGEEDIYGQRIACQTTTGVAGAGAAPRGISFGAARPNPFVHGTHMEITLDQARAVELVVWDVAGREVRRLVDGVLTGGTHEMWWDGRDQAGRQMPAGIYFARLSAGEMRAETKVLRLR
jgi:hypothetical protein